jgi:ankyrin repeat protein
LAPSSKNGLSQVVEALLEKYGEVAVANDGDAALALQCSCNSSNPGIAVASLLSALSGGGATNPLMHQMKSMLDDREPSTGLPAIFVACQRGSASAVEQLCHAGASVEYADATGRTLYHYLATYIPKLNPYTVLVVAAAACGLPARHIPGTKCLAVQAPHGHEMFVPKGQSLLCSRLRRLACGHFFPDFSPQSMCSGSCAGATIRATPPCTHRSSS